MIGLLPAAVTAVLALAVRGPDSRAITASSPQGLRPPESLRLYVLDCGILHNSDALRYRFKKEELVTSELSVACFLIAHPKGALVWDTGAVPDNALPARAGRFAHLARLGRPATFF